MDYERRYAETMLILFTELFPDIRKVADSIVDSKDNSVKYGYTYYSLEPIEANSPYYYLDASSTRMVGDSRMFCEYRNICKEHRTISELSNHEKSVVRGYYKYVYMKFAEVLEQKDANLDYLTETRARLANLETQYRMLAAFNANKIARYYYIEVDGYKFPVHNMIINPFDAIGREISEVNARIQGLCEKFNSPMNRNTKDRLSRMLKEFKEESGPRIGVIERSIATLKSNKYSVLIKLRETDVSYFGVVLNVDNVKSLSGVDLSSVVNYRGVNVNAMPKTNYAHIGVLNSDIYAVCLFNGVNCRPDCTEDYEQNMARVAEISRIHGLLTMIENRVCQEYYGKEKYTYDSTGRGYKLYRRYDLVEISAKIVEEYRKLKTTL